MLDHLSAACKVLSEAAVLSPHVAMVMMLLPRPSCLAFLSPLMTQASKATQTHPPLVLGDYHFNDFDYQY